MDISFLIPVRIDSKDRYNNFSRCINYLSKYAPYNIYILESDVTSNVPKILKKIKTNANIEYKFIYDNNILFHKTKFLNLLANKTNTEVIVNYDTDIILHPESYEYCYNIIKNKIADVVYPFAKGDYLINVLDNNINNINCDWCNISEYKFELKICNYGLCQFLNRKKFLQFGGMNEKFISYGPEDWELGYRLKQFKLKLFWLNCYIVHFNHTRGINSTTDHNMAKTNYSLYEYIQSLSLDDLRKYYNV